jgi:hypothetical protein
MIAASTDSIAAGLSLFVRIPRLERERERESGRENAAQLEHLPLGGVRLASTKEFALVIHRRVRSTCSRRTL